MSAPTLSSLLGSQVDAFHASIQPVTPAKGKKPTLRSPSFSSTPAPAAGALVTPFTHTVRQASLLSASSSAVAAPALASSLDTAHGLLALLLPKEVAATPPAADFHELFLQYLAACAGVSGTGAASAATAGAAADKKKRKRDEKEDGAAGAATAAAAAPGDRAALLGLYAVSTTVIGRLAARCITLLSSGPAPAAGAFDASLLQSTSSYWSVLWLLLRSDSLSARFTPSLYPLLTRHSALPLIECALVHLHDASERDLVEVAKYALDNLPQPCVSERTPELALDLLGAPAKAAEQPTKKKRKLKARSMVSAANAIQEPVKVVEVPGGPFAVILDLLLTSPVSANFLRHSLGALAPSHAHKLLLYLYAWTLRYWFHTESEVHQALHQITKDDKTAAAASASSSSNGTVVAPAGSKRSHFRIPSFSQVIDWMNILLDAIDFMRVYTKEEARTAAAAGADGSDSSDSSSLPLYSLVSSLASHISHHHLAFLERSQDLKGFIAIFAQMKRQPNAMPLPQAPMMDYNVEIIELGA